MDELFAAERTTRALLRRAPRQPWGYAAKADIARRIGDTLMLSSALDDLRRFAPGHYETTRVERPRRRAAQPVSLAAPAGRSLLPLARSPPCTLSRGAFAAAEQREQPR